LTEEKSDNEITIAEKTDKETISGKFQTTEEVTANKPYEDDKEPIKVAVVGDNSNASIIKEAMKDKNIKTVEMPYETNLANEEQIAKNKEDVLPPMGAKFMIAGKEYKVCYINAGKKRFSAEPCKGGY